MVKHNEMAMQTLSDLPTNMPVARVEFDYDYMSRRVGKTVYEWGSNGWQEVSSAVFLYDAWNLISEQTHKQTSAETNFFTFGLDLSGTLQGAGGIGGLVSAVLGTNAVCYTYDGNGNVSELINCAGGKIDAHYEYSPFGETIVATGGLAKDNPFRFSAKYTDDETSLVYYGFRFYCPGMGRWLSRDPLGDLAFRRIKEHSTQLAGFVDLSIHQIQKPIPSVNVGVSALQEQHRRILDSRRERSNADQKKNDDLLLGSMSYVALLNNPIQNHDFLGLHTVADCDADYDDCIAGCNGLSTARERCLCYIGCMTVYSGCLATAEEVLIIGGCVIVGGIIIYCTGGAAAPAVCCAL